MEIQIHATHDATARWWYEYGKQLSEKNTKGVIPDIFDGCKRNFVTLQPKILRYVHRSQFERIQLL